MGDSGLFEPHRGRRALLNTTTRCLLALSAFTLLLALALLPGWPIHALIFAALSTPKAETPATQGQYISINAELSVSSGNSIEIKEQLVFVPDGRYLESVHRELPRRFGTAPNEKILEVNALGGEFKRCGKVLELKPNVLPVLRGTFVFLKFDKDEYDESTHKGWMHYSLGGLVNRSTESGWTEITVPVFRSAHESVQRYSLTTQLATNPDLLECIVSIGKVHTKLAQCAGVGANFTLSSALMAMTPSTRVNFEVRDLPQDQSLQLVLRYPGVEKAG